MNYIKTGLLILALTALLIWIGGMVGGPRGAAIAFAVALVLNGVSYWYSDRIVLKMYRAKQLSPDTHSQLYNTVQELASNANIPCPRIFTASIDVPNAFATGRDPSHGVLCLTKGAMDLLDEQELRGVIAHELAHIANRDTLIMTVTAALASAVMMIAYMARWAALLGGFSRDRKGGGNLIGLLAVSILGPIAAVIVQLSISRSREYAADKGGAQIARDPEGLARALEDLQDFSKKFKFDPSPQTEHLFIVKPSSRNFLTNLFSTHPSVEERVKRLRGMV